MSDAAKAAAPVAATGILTALTGGIGAIAGPLLGGLGSALGGGSSTPAGPAARNVATGPQSFQDIFDAPFAVGSNASAGTTSRNEAETRGQIDQVASAGGSSAGPIGSTPGLFGSGVTAGEAQAAIPVVSLVIGFVVLVAGILFAFKKPKKKKEKSK